MTTLAVDTPRAMEVGDRNDIPVIASDIIYEGAAVGVVAASGHARPLTTADKFVGFCEQKADNSAGAAAAINVRVVTRGEIQLSVTGAVITDVGQPVYASDDNAFSFSPVGVYIGLVKRFVSSGVVIVGFDALNGIDPHGDYAIRELKSANYTLDAQDCGKLIAVDTDTVVISVPAIATGVDDVKIVNIAPFGTALISLSPVSADSLLAADVSASDGKDLRNTKATQKRGDFAVITLGDADGYAVKLGGTWARET